MHRTNAINTPHVTSTADRPRSTTKWRFFKENGIIQEDPGEEVEDEQEADEEMEQEQGHEKVEKKETGNGIQFFPGDISGLIKQFHLLLAEFHAGNKSSTKNQIVAILDDLLRRNYLNQEEYKGAYIYDVHMVGGEGGQKFRPKIADG